MSWSQKINQEIIDKKDFEIGKMIGEADVFLSESSTDFEPYIFLAMMDVKLKILLIFGEFKNGEGVDALQHRAQEVLEDKMREVEISAEHPQQLAQAREIASEFIDRMTKAYMV